mgnify:CR=1 FL=1|tara:strand:+ start:9168 stop:10796 length:1629 start_codon:yes stop_codon:yes gene_type:complete
MTVSKTHVPPGKSSGDFLPPVTASHKLGSSDLAWSEIAVGSTGWANANHTHAASNSGGTVAATTSTLASTVTVVDSTDTSSFIAMFDSATGSLAAKTDAGLTYNAGTGMLTATGFTGPLTGNASGTAATVTGGTQASITSAANLATVGTITTGVWQGTTVAVNQGGTGATTLNNLITLSTHTTGNYAATITGGTGITSTGATSGEGIAHSLSVDASQTQITSVGALNAGSITSGFGNIDNGSSTLDTGSLTADGDIRSHAARPAFQLSETGASSDENWEMINNSGVFTLSTQNDAFTGASARMTITNAGIIQFPLGELDMNTVASGGIRNVGESGNDWTANTFALVGSTTGVQGLFVHNNSGNNATTTAAHIELKVNATAGNLSGDPRVRYFVSGGSNWATGIDNSEDDRFVIANDTDLGGSADAVRISTGEVVTFNTTQGSDFDYWCDGCGKTALTMFDCCGKVTWHDDTAALSLMPLSEEGLQHMAKIGVMDVDDSQEERWVGINMQAATNFTWGAVRQNRQRMDSQYEELNKRLEAIGG